MKGKLEREQKEVLDKVAEFVLEYLDETEFGQNSRDRELVDRRRLFYIMAKKFTSYSLKTIGAYLNQDHSTVLFGIKSLKDIMEYDDVLQTKYEELSIIFENEFVDKTKKDSLEKAIKQLSSRLKKLKKEYYELTDTEFEDEKDIKEIECEVTMLDSSGVPIRKDGEDNLSYGRRVHKVLLRT